MTEKTEKDLIRAAGGLVWREGACGPEVLVIHRQRYDDWTLPKGKLDPGERWEQAALREVAEETGYQVRLDGFAGLTFYYHDQRPKVVLFWNMIPQGESSDIKSGSPDEGDVVLWLTPEEASARLDYPGEIELVESEGRRWR